mgnify:CR=1 FL=1
MSVPIVILAIIAIVVGVVGGYYLRKSVHERKLDAAKYTACLLYTSDAADE